MKELVAIQKEVKCPKSRKNTFGNYMYRNCDDIYDAVKPICEKNNCSLTVTDSVVMFADRFYIQAVARLSNGDGAYVECSGLAREPLTKKGMDEGQITGTASSYARKIALGGLFLLDDSHDVDGAAPAEAEGKPYTPKKGCISIDQAIALRDFFSQIKGYTEADFCKDGKIAKLEDLMEAKYAGAVAFLTKKMPA